MLSAQTASAAANNPRPIALTGPKATAITPVATITPKTNPAIRSTVSSIGSNTFNGRAEPEAMNESPTSISCAVDKKAFNVRSVT